MDNTTRILLADDHEVVRRGLRTLIESSEGMEICGEAVDGREVVELATKLKPNVVIMDLCMPLLNGIEATRQVLERSPSTRVLVFSMHRSEKMVQEVVKAGARGYVLKSDASKDLIVAIEVLQRGEVFFSARIADMMAGVEQCREAGAPLGGLTRREQEILQLLAEGHSNKAAGKVLGISMKTVETHRARIMRKLHIDSVADLVRYAIRNQMIQP